MKCSSCRQTILWMLSLALFGYIIASCDGEPPTTGGAAAPSPAPQTGTPGPAQTPSNPLDRARFSTHGWKTDFSRHSVPLEEITSGGPPRDAIPPIDTPIFLPAPEGDRYLKEQEPVIAFSYNGDARAYPLQILIWHEIVNDQVGSTPVVVTFCPLCNTAIVFERTFEGKIYDFGTTGNLRHSDLVMWDRQTESWWQQITGEAIVGTLTGARLVPLPAAIVSWREFKAAYPRGTVLSRDTGHIRDYGVNPYTGYDNANEPPFLFRDTADPRLPPKERVVTVSLGDEDVAYPWSVLQKARVIHDVVGDQPVVIFWQPGTVSALDRQEITGSRDVGAAAVFLPIIEGRRLSFRADGDGFIDTESQSRWNLLGQAVAGPYAGGQLQQVVSGNHLWFSWAVFKPGTRIYQLP